MFGNNLYYIINGEIKYRIEKDFRKIKANSDLIKASKGSIKFKNPILDLSTDNEGRLWSIISTVRDKTDKSGSDKDLLSVDIFKEGIFQNCVKIDVGLSEDYFYDFIYISGNRLYVTDLVNTEIRVYEYSVK